MSLGNQSAVGLSALVQRYLEQQAELYGGQFYSDLMKSTKGTVAEDGTLETFNRQIENCEKCRLSKSRTSFVFGTGDPMANLMCIGEAPGFDEDREGEPFVGAAGQLLNKILGAIGFGREEVYIANIIKCRPPGNRDPDSDEIGECMPYLQKQIDMIDPKLILALGRVAAQTLLKSDAPLGGLRGRIHHYNNRKVVVTYHPAALLRNPKWKRSAWEDVKTLRTIYDQEVGDKAALDLV